MILQVVMDSSVQKGSLEMVGPEMFCDDRLQSSGRPRFQQHDALSVQDDSLINKGWSPGSMMDQH